MIDFHSHILPGIDDGSRNVEESIALLRLLSEQGVDTVVATPHFHANHGTAEDFIRRREKAYNTLISGLPEDEKLPQIKCGAEVRYYNGISRMSDLSKLCVEGSSLLLLEMPMSKWTQHQVKELAYLSGNGDMRILLAHVERCIGFQNKEVVDILHENGILMQVNAEFFKGFFRKRKALSMLARGEVHLIGSDCHNLTSRKPIIGDAFKTIEKKLGERFVAHLERRGEALLKS